MVTRKGNIPFLMELSFKREKGENKQIVRYESHISLSNNYCL